MSIITGLGKNIRGGIGKAATYVGEALGGSLDSNMARVASKAETQAGKKYLSRVERASRRSKTIQRGMHDPIPESETVRIQKEARRSAINRSRKGENVGRVGTPERKATILAEQLQRSMDYQNNRALARAMRLNRGVTRGSLGLAAGTAMSSKGPNESRTSYRGPGAIPGLRKPMGTGRYAG